jgi:hypothetical protein
MEPRATLVVLALAAAAAAAPPQPSLFTETSTVELTLEAPLQELFAAAKDDPDASVPGRLSARSGDASRVTVSVRGNTSARSSECSFPKLKLRFDDLPADGSPLAGIRTLKIGTHCGESATDRLTRFGRIANEHAAHREALVYRLLKTLGVPTLDARPARMTYRDPSAIDRPEPLTRDALLLEDDAAAAERLGAKDAIPMERFGSADRRLSVENRLAIAFGEALAGNFDWCLKFTPQDTYRCDARKPLWNILAFARKDGGAVALVYDFDVSGMVAGRHAWFRDIFNAAFSDPPSEPAVEVVSQLQHARTVFLRAELDAARRRFASKKEAAMRALAEADVDPEGREQASAYARVFFDAMEHDRAFYVPVVARPDTKLWSDAARTRPACPGQEAAPVGTPVGPVLARAGGAVQATVLDALWHWTGRASCAAILKGPVWIDAEAVSGDYPAQPHP